LEEIGGARSRCGRGIGPLAVEGAEMGK